MHTHTQMKGSKLTHQSTFLYNIKSTIRTLAAWLNGNFKAPAFNLVNKLCVSVYLSDTEIDYTTSNKMHDWSRTNMAHVLSFSFATWASEIKFSPGINAYAKQRGSPGYCTG